MLFILNNATLKDLYLLIDKKAHFTQIFLYFALQNYLVICNILFNSIVTFWVLFFCHFNLQGVFIKFYLIELNFWRNSELCGFEYITIVFCPAFYWGSWHYSKSCVGIFTSLELITNVMDEVLCTNMVWKWEKQLLTGTAWVLGYQW